MYIYIYIYIYTATRRARPDFPAAGQPSLLLLLPLLALLLLGRHNTRLYCR